MSEIFLKLLNMSISASWIVLVVLALRLLLKKAPKWVRVLLWGIVALRLLCPFSIESTLSLIPAAETVSPGIMMDRTPQIDSGVPVINAVVNPIISGSFTPQPMASANPLQIWIPVAANFWILGMIVLLLYTAASYWRVKRKVRTAVLLKENIFQSEHVVSPFVLGIIKPKIYLPFQMSQRDMSHVIAHEKAHISRKDHWWKPVGFLILTIYWFNPLLWLAYVLLCRDIELACDEKVVGDFTVEEKADYSQALLSCSVGRRMIAACPLAFGEVSVKNRVKSVLHYKKPAFWIVLVAILVSVAVALCFLTDPKISINEELSLFIDTQIADHFYSPAHTGENFVTVHHKVLGVEKSQNKTTVYMWVLYREYNCENGKIQEKTGSHIPTVITAKRTGSHGHYELVEYWEPRDGGYNVPDIKGKFPWYLHDKALDSQRYIKEQSAWCNQSAEEYYREEQQNQNGNTDLPIQVSGRIPTLFAVASDTYVEAATGTVSWMYQNEDGTSTHVNYDSSHPLVFKGSMPVLYMKPSILSHVDPLQVHLRFVSLAKDMPPNRVEVRCWAESEWDKEDPADEDVQVTREDGEIFIKLKDGKYIYEVVATWSGSNKHGGTVRYCFRTGKPSLEQVTPIPEKIEVYEKTPAEQINQKMENEEFVYTATHYKSEDVWVADRYLYRYRLEITGRMHNAAKNSTYIVLSNTEDITFDMAWKAAGYSSNSEDYFDPQVAMIVGSRLFE